MNVSELTTNQRRALTALLTNATIEAAAAECGLTERTIYNYLANETFKQELSRRQDEIVRTVTAALVGLAGKAVNALADILDDDDATQATKARVAIAWLKQMSQSVELADLSERVGKLEEIANEFSKAR